MPTCTSSIGHKLSFPRRRGPRCCRAKALAHRAPIAGVQLSREANTLLSGCSSQNTRAIDGKENVKGIEIFHLEIYCLPLPLLSFFSVIATAANPSTVKFFTYTLPVK